jgi:hypothetical protein
MKTRHFLFTLLLSLFSIQPILHAAEEVKADDPGAVVEKFYADYIAQIEGNKDTTKWVAASKSVTENFKKTYAKAMSVEELEADPVLNAQDVPEKPFKASKTEITDNKATVVLTTTFDGDKHQVTATLLKVDGTWLLDAVK